MGMRMIDEIDALEAMRQLTNDFGAEFVATICAVAAHRAAEVISQDGAPAKISSNTTIENMIRSLSEDFGSEFVNLICAVAANRAAEVVSKVIADSTPIPMQSLDGLSGESLLCPPEETLVVSTTPMACKGKQSIPSLGRTTVTESPLYKYTDFGRAEVEEQIYYNPPDFCDCCPKPLLEMDYFVDGALNDGSGQWAIMCETCFGKVGKEIRWGSGQLYMKQIDGDWLCVGGFEGVST